MKAPRLVGLFASLVSLTLFACTPEPPAAEDAIATALSESSPAIATPDTDAPVSGCSVERSCGRATIVCKQPDQPRPCGAAGCAEMQFACSADADCLEGYRCAACAAGDPFPCGLVAGRCQPRSCRVDSDCRSRNLSCQAGSCAHRACKKSSACKGYCVAGACWDRLGWCHDTTLPPPP